jgi:glycosyltransferase involved in cell wall biosynthesis
MKLSIIIPVFNEEKTVAKVIDKITNLSIAGVTKEIIIVDDGSTDSSGEIVKKKTKGTNIKFIKHNKNQGKGRAVRTGISSATGDYIVIQDADLEYDPKYIRNLVAEVKNKNAEVVYGSRLNRLPNLSKEERTIQFLLHYVGNRFLSLFISILYMHWLTDMETCYKLFPKKAVEKINLKARGFELEPEITSKLLKKGYKIMEIPITATPRGYNEGKKLNTVKDGVKAFWVLLKYRFVD